MRFVIENSNTEPEEPCILSLSKSGSSVALRARNGSVGATILLIRDSGVINFIGAVSPNLGFKLDNDMKVKSE